MYMRLLVLIFAVVSCCAAQPAVYGVTNAGDYSGRISPGSIVTLFGADFTNLDPAGATEVPLPPSLAGVTVFVDGSQCPMFYADATQINFQIPYEIQPGAATLTVASGTGNTPDLPITVDTAAPGILLYGSDRAVAVNYSEGTLNQETDPVNAGDALIVYITGVGPVTVTPADGDANSLTAISYASSTFSATIGGVDAPVGFLGLAPGYVGLGQANLTVPALANGDYPLTITVNGFISASAIVTVSGAGTPPPAVLTYLTTAATTAPPLQNTVYGYSAVQANGTFVYVCGPTQITVIDVTNPQSPVAAGSFGTSDLNSQGSNCAINQDYLIDIVGGSQFLVYDLITSATNPQLVAGPVSLPQGFTGSVVFDGTTGVFDSTFLSWDSNPPHEILSESGVVDIYSFSNYAAPAFVGTFNPPAGYTDNTSPRFGMADLGNAYVAVTGTTDNGVTGGGSSTSGSGQFTVVDVLNPAAPAGASEVIVAQTAVLHDIAAQGTTALITGNTQAWPNPIPYVGANAEVLNQGDLTLSLVDFTNPQAPVVLTASYADTGIQASTVCRAVSLGGGFFAVIIAPPVSDFAGASTLAVVDTRNHSTYTLAVYPFATINGLSTMAVSGNYLYVVTAQGLNIYTITLPTS